MSDQKKYDNSGIVFVNDRKEKEAHPDRTGTACIDGVDYYISGWVKKGAKGSFLTLSFKKKEAKVEESKARPVQPQLNNDNFDNDVPW